MARFTAPSANSGGKIAEAAALDPGARHPRVNPPHSLQTGLSIRRPMLAQPRFMRNLS